MTRTTTTTVELLTTAEVAAVLRCSTEYVAKLCKAKRIRAVNLGGQQGWRVHPDELDAFVRGRSTPARVTAARGSRAAK